MIILNNNNNANVNIPDYDDLVNKPSINGVVLEGNKTAGELGIDVDTTNFYTKREVNERIADSITGIENEFGNYYTKSQSDSKYQPKGNYLTSIPSGYATESWVENKGYLTSIPSEYVTESELSGKNYATKSEIPTIPTNISSFNNDSGYITNSALSGYATESWVSDNYQTKGEYATVDYVDSENEYLQGEIDAKQNILVSGGNIKTINGQTILGSGNIIIDGGSGGSTDLTGYATEDWVSANYQTKGNYLTTIPSEYITEAELNDAIAELGGSESVAYLIIEENASENAFNYVGGSFEDVVNAYNNNKPYFIYVPNGAGVGYYSLAETTVITNTYIQCLSFAHTGVAHTWRYWRLYSERPMLYNQTTYEYATTTQLNSKQNTLVSGDNIKTINGQSLLGSGNITIESGTTIPTMFIPKGYSGSVDLSILTPIYDAVMNNKPWIVWGDLGAANGRYNMVECSTIGDNTITFYDNSVASDNSISIIRYWTFNITDGTFVMEERNIAFATTTDLSNYYTKSEIDTQIGDINTILENILN